MPDYRDWLEKGLNKDGVDVASVAAALGKHHSVVYKLVNGERKFHADELSKIADAIKEPVPLDSITPRSFSYRKHIVINNSAIISAGEFSPPKPANPGDLMVVFPDAQYPKARMIAFGVTGNHLEANKICDGDKLFCLDYNGAGGFPALREGVPIVVERTRRRKHEMAIMIASLSHVDGDSSAQIALDVRPLQAEPKNGNSKRSTDAIRVIAVVRSSLRTFA
jgi:hypothetical protein